MKRIIVMILFVMPSLHAYFGSYERIVNFHSDIEVHQKGHLTVHETIKIVLPAGRHGIFRDFPTVYRGPQYNDHIIDFEVESISLNGGYVPYQVNDIDCGKRIKIGDPHFTLSGGTYTYEIFYTTSRQLGFFEKYDELYWNVTGNGWGMPIETASAQVTLPNGANIIHVGAYTGYRGDKGARYESKIINAYTAFWQTKSSLRAQEGLTIVVTWPKGIVHPPSMVQNMSYGIRDYGPALFLLICFLMTAMYIIYACYKISKEQESGTIIPLFYPPENLTPAQTRYVMKRRFDHTGLASEIVDLAVQGFITIEYKKHFFSREYILHKTKKTTNDKGLPSYYKRLVKRLFEDESCITLNKSNSKTIGRVIEMLQDELDDRIGNKHLYNYFFDYWYALLYFIVIAFYMIGMSMAIVTNPLTLFCLVTTGGMYAVLLCILGYCANGYTVAGKKLRDEIEGFKLYLKTAESEQMKIVGTPPTKTPELYEKYLPYAIALGVEEQWSAQFAPIFVQMMQASAAAQTPYYYRPHWYSGGSDGFTLHDFSSSLSSTISSSVPGSSSGADGGGDSGGGGGGGGGGSW